MEKKLRRWDSRASEAYLDRLKDVKTPEEKEQIFKEQERYVAWSNAIQAKIRYAYEIKDSPKESPKKGSDKEQSPEERLGNEYLYLEQPDNVPAVRQISRHELDLMFGTGMTPTSNMPSPQKIMDEKIPEVLKESRVTSPISDKSKKKKEELLLEKKPLPQREKIKILSQLSILRKLEGVGELKDQQVLKQDKVRRMQYKWQKISLENKKILPEKKEVRL